MTGTTLTHFAQQADDGFLVSTVDNVRQLVGDG